MAANQGIQYNSRVLAASNLTNLVGISVEAKLTGSNEVPAVSDLVLSPTVVTLTIRPNTIESSCDITVVRSNSLITSILERVNGELVIYVYGILADQTKTLLKTYSFNYQDFNDSWGASSGTVILSGTKIISDLAQGCQRNLSKYISRQIKPYTGIIRYTYEVGYLDIFAFKGGDYLFDGEYSTFIDSIKLNIGIKSVSAKLETY